MSETYNNPVVYGVTATKYYITDNVGSTAVETDANGNVLNASLFFPYGVERIVQQSDTANNYRFSGKERDPNTGLDDFGARYYDSVLGRFMTPDWDAKPTAVPYAAFGDPQTLNLYSYVENGPLNRVDADGHADEQTPTTGSTLPAGVEFAPGGPFAPTFSGGEFGLQVEGGYTEATYLAMVDAAQKQQTTASTGNTASQQELSKESESAIENSKLSGEQAGAFEKAVKTAGNANGINPNALVGIAMNESSLDPTAKSKKSSASGLFGLTDSTKNTYGLSAADATGTSAAAITKQVNAAASYLHDLMQGSVPSSHPSHQFEIALGYFRGSRVKVNRAIASKGGYNSMLKLRYGGESLGHYIRKVESYE